MAINISHLQRVSAVLPARTLIYGPPGMGKTTLASEWPDPVFLQVEDGTPGDLELTTFGLLTTYEEVMESISALYSEAHGLKTVVIDSLDRLEPLVWAQTCEDNNWTSIEAPGYGRGYVEADRTWRALIEGVNSLRRDRGMNVVYVAHSAIANVDNPMTQAYSRFDIRLHKRAINLFQDEVDIILFLNQDIVVQTDKSKGGARARAEGGGHRWIYAAPRPAFVAKNRYGVPDRLEFKQGSGYMNMAPYLPDAVQVPHLNDQEGVQEEAQDASEQAPDSANEQQPEQKVQEVKAQQKKKRTAF